MKVPKKYTGEAHDRYKRIVKRCKPRRASWNNPAVAQTGEKAAVTDEYEKYAAWCRSLGITPADVETYQKVNR
jgi:hypothetical protein